MNDRISQLINAYIDGSATQEQRAEFDSLLASDPDVRREFELQLRIESRLRTLMQVPAAPAAPESAGNNRDPQSSHSIGRRAGPMVWAKIAAAILLVGVAAWASVTRPWRALMPLPESSVATNVVFDRLVGDGFVPTVVCDSDTKFRTYTKEKLGTEFLIKAPDNVQLVGWTYANGLLGDETPILMARLDGKPLIVVMNRASQDHQMRLSPTAKCARLHKREFGDLVFYEYSDAAEPVVISHLVKP